MIRPIIDLSTQRRNPTPEQRQNTMSLRKFFLTAVGVLGLACTPVCATPPTATKAPPPVVSVTTSLPPARIRKTLADYKRWLVSSSNARPSPACLPWLHGFLLRTLLTWSSFPAEVSLLWRLL